MSNTVFIESLSADPTERAIARKVSRILNDRSLDRQQRESLVKNAQRELLQHRAQQAARSKLQAQLAQVALPQGYRSECVQVHNGQVALGVAQPRQAFTWVEAGAAPDGLAERAMELQHPPKGSRSAKTGVRQPFDTRRRELGLTRPAPTKPTRQG